MSADPSRMPQTTNNRRPWIHPELTRLRVSDAEFGGGITPDLDAVPS